MWTSITRSKMRVSCSDQLFAKALGDRVGINRAGYFVVPMDETLAVVARRSRRPARIWSIGTK